MKITSIATIFLVAWFIWQRHPVDHSWSRMWNNYPTKAACEAVKRDYEPLRPRVKLKCLPEGKLPDAKQKLSTGT